MVPALTYFPHDYAMGIDPVQLGKDVSVWVPAIYGTKPPANAEMSISMAWAITGGPTRTMLDRHAMDQPE